MVKNKNYNHPEVGVLREDELNRMKVLPITMCRKPSANPPRRSWSRSGSWPKKKKSTNWHWRRPRGRRC